MSDNNNSISLKDTNSQILSIVPKDWAIPLIIISKVKGYDSVDSYVLEIIRDRLSAFSDSRDELGESFQKYMQGIEGLEDLSTAEEEDPNKEDNSSQFVKDVQENYHDMKKSEDKDLR